MRRKYFPRGIRLPFDREYFLSGLSGAHGGLATTTAIIAGLTVSTEQADIVITSAVIAFLVQAFNSSASLFLAEHTNHEIEHYDFKSYRKPFMDSLVYFTSHIIMGLLVIIPFAFIVKVEEAMVVSIAITLIFLFFSGAYKGHLLKGSPLRDGLEVFVSGALIISVGIIAGIAVNVV